MFNRHAPAAVAVIVMVLCVIGLLISAANTEPSQLGVPVDGQLGYQVSATTVADDVDWLTYWLHWVAALITLFVTVLLAYVCWNFSEKKNPTPQTFTHNTTIEVVWTVVPVIVLIAIAIPSLSLLYKQETVPPAEVTVKAIGNQWYWEYAYDIDGEEVYVESYMTGLNYATYDQMVEGETARLIEEGASEDEIAAQIPTRDKWKLDATAAMVVPVDTIVRVQVTAADVLHAWMVPSFGVKVDAVPGRLNETWFNARETGTYYGQCSELCGRQHAYMPIEVEVVSRADWDARLQAIKQEWASSDVPEEIRLAANAPVFGAE